MLGARCGGGGPGGCWKDCRLGGGTGGAPEGWA